jgi:hypothetical protein
VEEKSSGFGYFSLDISLNIVCRCVYPKRAGFGEYVHVKATLYVDKLKAQFLSGFLWKILNGKGLHRVAKIGSFLFGALFMVDWC